MDIFSFPIIITKTQGKNILIDTLFEIFLLTLWSSARQATKYRFDSDFLELACLIHDCSSVRLDMKGRADMRDIVCEKKGALIIK